ncbi:MAG: RtcB family protein [Armatimonadetes bacterium]|nr:RtcB family protein [Armatimonadota bacterium]
MARVATGLKRLDEFRWKIEEDYKPGMRVPGIIYANEELMKSIAQDQAVEQVANVAMLPGIVKASLAMPDIHWGYGFPIGGVAATSTDDGVISPGGIGFDVNCGVRLLRSRLTEEDVRPVLKDLVDQLYVNIPSGVGAKGKIRLDRKGLEKVAAQGSQWAVSEGYGWHSDLDATESRGKYPGADPTKVGPKPYERGAGQLGTLGSGNHFLEVEVVDKIYRPNVAAALGLEEGMVTILIHTGSRGFGHQMTTDYLVVMDRASKQYGISLPDRQLACAPFSSSEGQDYLAAMACAANFAWANRQCITHWTRQAFEQILKKNAEQLGLHVVYDLTHNVAKIEDHTINGTRKTLCIHRKGATRAYPPGHPELPETHKPLGQVVLVPGDMGRYSYVLVGTEKAAEDTFACTCHGAGRMKSRGQAKRDRKARDVMDELASKGIIIRAENYATITEEAPDAYKDAGEVVKVCEGAGISLRVARLRPIGVVKG